MRKLIIVESPTKAKTIAKFLGTKNYTVLSSQGHVRDLPASQMGIDTEHDFAPKYVIPPKARKTIKTLKESAKSASEVILATDEDREGEAIGWHIGQILDLDPATTERIVFHEITKSAIEDALKSPRHIDMHLVEAQQARRIVDRLVGYKLSPFLWKKIYRGLSAGRVQSVALRMIVEREDERRKFVSAEYWKIVAHCAQKGKSELFDAELSAVNGKKLDKLAITTGEAAQQIIDDVQGMAFIVEQVENKETVKNPLPPFTTSTLQQEAFKRLGFSSRQTMMLAQGLYEGKDIGTGGSTGLITYMRTDSLNLSAQSLASAREVIGDRYGKNYLPVTSRHFKSRSKNAQEAHEAIRPTDPHIMPESITSHLSAQEFKLYNLIWRRFTASQMAQAIFDSSKATIVVSGKSDAYQFKANGSVLKFDGFLAVWPTKSTDVTLPKLSSHEELDVHDIEGKQSFTQPPARYSEATLIKVLEEYSIGRPSTYAPIISNITSRGYVGRDDEKKLYPTEIGEKVNMMLVQNFPDVVDYHFTSQMENNLDEIAEGKKEWVNVLSDFYGPFEKNLEEKYKAVKKETTVEETDEICPLCGAQLVIKQSRFGKFYACSKFPECRYTKSIQDVLAVKCPKCETGDIVAKRTKRGKVFYGCSNYPQCDFALWDKPTGEKCPLCGSLLVEKGKKVKCSNKECSYTQG